MSEPRICFVTSSGKEHFIEKENLEEYPNSMLSLSAFSPYGRLIGHVGYTFVDGPQATIYIKTQIPDDAMVHISYFYATGMWRNPIYDENRWSLDGKGARSHLEEICDFLGLPSYVEEEIDDDDLPWDGIGYDEEELEEMRWNMNINSRVINMKPNTNTYDCYEGHRYD